MMDVNRNGEVENRSINTVSVKGFKSIVEEQSIDIKPLTLLVGVNSSGKSSIMQPLLLLKQTLDASYDPGPLLLNGPNVKFTSSDQLLAFSSKSKKVDQFTITLTDSKQISVSITFRQEERGKLNCDSTHRSTPTMKYEVNLRMSDSQVKTLWKRWIDSQSAKHLRAMEQIFGSSSTWKLDGEVERNRCFLELHPTSEKMELFPGVFRPAEGFEPLITQVIHVPGLRGNPERSYPVTAVGTAFPGTFEKYVASIVTDWGAKPGNDKLRQLGETLQGLGLTWKVRAKPINDTQVELHVGRLPNSSRGGAHDTVNIADVGFGISQTLPVVVALLAATPGQLVYIEQPEIHLHPRAQVAMAETLATAAQRGVKVVAETHSHLVLLGVQTLVAEGKLDPSLVKLHWFQRDKHGATQVISADLDETGAFGDWPVDFADVSLRAESRYLDAAESQLLKR